MHDFMFGSKMQVFTRPTRVLWSSYMEDWYDDAKGEDGEVDWDEFRFLAELRWEDVCDGLTYLIEEIQPDKYSHNWFATVSNFGWRNQDGHASFRAWDGKELLQGILPRADNHFRIFRCHDHTGPYLQVQNYHHDSPTGREWYTIYPARECEGCAGDFPIGYFEHELYCPECEEDMCDDCGEIDNYCYCGVLENA